MRTPYEVGVATADTDREIRFDTADGVHSKREPRESELVLAGGLWRADPDETLVVDANYGLPGVAIADRTRVTMTTASTRAGHLARHNAARAGVSTRVVVTGDPARVPRTFDAAGYAPKPYTPTAMGKRRTLDALRTLASGGELHLAGRETTGLGRYEDVLDTVGAEPTTVTSRGDTRLVRATRPASFSLGDSKPVVEPRCRPVAVARTTIHLVTVPGVFAAPGLDDGTRHLLEQVVPGDVRSADRVVNGDETRVPPIADDDRVLDACCGAGPIAACVGRTTGATVTATDDDPVAVACARRTVAASGVAADVRLGDRVTSVNGPFDRVVCNPPTHAGHDLLAELFTDVRRVLAPDGSVTLVHHRSVPFDDLLAPFSRVRDGPSTETYRLRHCDR